MCRSIAQKTARLPRHFISPNELTARKQTPPSADAEAAAAAAAAAAAFTLRLPAAGRQRRIRLTLLRLSSVFRPNNASHFYSGAFSSPAHSGLFFSSRVRTKRESFFSPRLGAHFLSDFLRARIRVYGRTRGVYEITAVR